MRSYRLIKTISFLTGLLLLSGCAVSRPSIEAPSPGTPDIATKAGRVSAIEGITFTEEENFTRIKISGSETLEAPFYKLLTDPLRLIIDLPNVDLKQLRDPIKIENGTVGEVTATQLDDKGRIEIGLLQMTNYNISKEEKDLIIDIEKIKAIAEAKEGEKPEEPVKEKEAEIPPPEMKKEEAVQVQPVETPPVQEVSKKAKNILTVSLDQKKDSITFQIIADGSIGNYNAFKLDSPSRLVLDIWEVGSRYPKDLIKIQNRLIKQVRIGRHPDKMRFVFDSLKPQLPPYQINRMDDKLMVSFGKVPQPSEPQILVPEKPSVGVPAPKARVNAPIEFKQMDNKSRIVVSLTEEPKFESQLISKDVIAVDIKNAFVPRRLQRELDTSAFDSAVKSVELKNIRSGEASDVRILIRLKEEVPFETAQEGKSLLIDIERPKKAEAKIGAPSEIKREEVSQESRKEEPKEEAVKKEGEVKKEVKEEVKKEEAKPSPEGKKTEKGTPRAEEKPLSVIPPVKKAEEEKKVIEEAPSEKVYTGRRVSLDFKDADIKNILRLIAEVSNFNIITGDDVSGKITMRLVDVPWDQALDVILQARSLGMKKVGNVIRIAPLDTLKKEIQTELEARRAKEKLEDLMTELIPVNYATAKEILPQVKSILSERGDIKVDDRTNILIVKDIARNIAAAKSLIKSLDTKTPQVLIEARIVEATLTFQRDLGISWGFLAEKGTDKRRTYSVGGGTAGESTLRAPSGTASVDTRKFVDLPTSTAAGLLEFLFTSDYGLKNLDVAISAYESKGDVKVISSPKIATLDNKEASVEQGLRIPYTKLTTEGTVTEEFIEANLKLIVTPHVTNDGHIKMSIKVKKDEPSKAFVSKSDTPSIDKKEAITEVLVKDNGVVAIAGIYTIKNDRGTTGVPFLSKIPVLGWLFKKESKTNDTKDLLIFISPKIFKDQV
ncbi:MAG: type IV pilus secretin PilQ [Syntrophaceae bacterium]|nr:type IV pilus secretin PilQ [Syntrophaceae bacterium]